MEKLSVGQEVRVFDANGHRVGQPEGGWRGVIRKVGRTIVHIDYPGHYGTQAFRMDTQRANDQYGRQYFRTLNQTVIAEREQRAREILADRGIRFDRHRPVTLEQMEELAEVVERWSAS